MCRQLSCGVVCLRFEQTYSSLPDADKITFQSASPVDIQTVLPNLLPDLQIDGVVLGQERTACLDLIKHLVVLEPSRRQRPSDVLKQTWFTTGLPVLLPHDYPADAGQQNIIAQFKDKSLADHLTAFT